MSDRHSPDPLGDRPLLSDNATFEWGKGAPLEKVIDSPAAFDALLTNPQLFRNAITIFEPWHHVGANPLGEDVRASVNVAYLAQKIADCDSIVFPMWKSGPLNLTKLIPVISSGLAIVVEGDNPSLRDPATFAGANCSHTDMVQLTEQILLSAPLPVPRPYSFAWGISLPPKPISACCVGR